MLTDADRAVFRSGNEKFDAQVFTVLDRILEASKKAGGNKDVRNKILLAIPKIIQAHGDLTAEFAAEMYSLARATAGLDDVFTPVPFMDIPDEMIAGSVQWALSQVDGVEDWSAIPDAVFVKTKQRLFATASRLGRKASAHTVLVNTGRDPGGPRMRRVPSAGACGWCMLLATRGYVYSAGTVLRTHDGARYHDRCKCSAEPEYPGEELPPFLYRIQDARKKYPSFDDFDAFVKNGGLGDRPIPGRDAAGKYRRTVDGKEVPFSRSDVEVFLKDAEKQRGLWFDHVMKPPSGRGSGGHAFEHAQIVSDRVKRGGKLRSKKTFFPAGYSFDRFSKHVRDTLGDPTYIREGKRGGYIFRREFSDLTIEVIVKPGGKNKPYSVRTAYPVAGGGFEVVKSGDIINLPSSAKRVI